jgi:hypothetical protein
MPDELALLNWDRRPAVACRSRGRAWAVLRDASWHWEPRWSEVDYLAVINTGYATAERDWHTRFGQAVRGAGGLDALPLDPPPPRHP